MNKNITTGIVLVLVIGGFWFLLQNKKPAFLETESTSIGDKKVDILDSLNIDNNTDSKEVGSITKLENKDKIMTATFNTTKGSFTVEFFESQAPKTVANFIKLAKSGFYSGVKFHRVIKGFMIQGGDPLTKDDSKMNIWGTGGPGYTFADEITDKNKNDVGTIAMANAGPNTNGSQFFINVNANNFLDTKHTVFGHVISGMDVVSMIENSLTDSSDRPVQAIIIESIVLK